MTGKCSGVLPDVVVDKVDVSAGCIVTLRCRSAFGVVVKVAAPPDKAEAGDVSKKLDW